MVMKGLTPQAVAEAAGGTYIGSEEGRHTAITAVTTDSRNITPGCLFAALKGERADGHAYIAQAVRAGAGAVLAEHLPAEDMPVPAVLVKDTGEALKAAAGLYLRTLGIPAVGIVGSAGKTSTKEMVAAVLSQRYRTLKTEGNFNNELGVPLTIFRLREEDEIAVIEMGINHFGEMSRLGAVVRPDTVVMTNIGTAHLEYLHDRDGILKAKSEVFAYLQPGGHVVLNGDDDKLITVESVNGKPPVRFGIGNAGADVRAEDIVSCGLEGSRFRLCLPDEELTVQVPSPGVHSVYNALAGAAVGVLYGLTGEEIRKGIESYESLTGRLRLLQVGERTVIDDCYNANPSSMKASLRILGEAEGRKAAILGDMGELGERTAEWHREVGVFAEEQGVDVLLCVGELSRHMAGAAREAAASAGKTENERQVLHFADTEELLKALPAYIGEKDTVLVKASHFMAFGRVVEALKKL